MKRLPRAVARTLLHPPVGGHRLFGSRPRNDLGVPLDSQTHALLSWMGRMSTKAAYELSLEDAREQYDWAYRMFDVREEPVARVTERWIPSTDGHRLRTRIYWPSDAPDLPAVVFYHGGGFVIGSVEGYDRHCRHLCNATGAAIVNVDYRLSPEYAFPAAVEDADAAFVWTWERAAELGIDRTRIAVAGDSAGGNLAAVVCQLRHIAGGPHPALQVLLYPAIHEHGDYASRTLFEEGFMISKELMTWFRAQYLQGYADSGRDHRCSPILYEGLGELPEAWIMTTGFDPLRDEGRAYADRVRREGGRVTHHERLDQVHGFLCFAGLLDSAQASLGDMTSATRVLLRR